MEFIIVQTRPSDIATGVVGHVFVVVVIPGSIAVPADPRTTVLRRLVDLPVTRAFKNDGAQTIARAGANVNLIRVSASANRGGLGRIVLRQFANNTIFCASSATTSSVGVAKKGIM